MAVEVYFRNGNTSMLPTGTQVAREEFPGTRHYGSVIKDADGKDVGRFLTTEIIGYLFYE